MAQSRLQFAQHSVKQVIGIQLVQILNGRNGIKAGLWPVDVGNDNSAIEGDHWRIIELNQAIIKRQNLPPVGGPIVRRGAVAGSDARLKMILGDLIACSRLREVKHAPRDYRLVPSRPVLFLEAEQVALTIDSSRDSRGVQQHQRQQGMSLGLI